ncbi:MAG: glycosyltransferase family 2 protein [Deltaproteobacteria bacterium]|nr:glycosyltransferase family 2 protein [Deltaproteobacteria bacterium]
MNYRLSLVIPVYNEVGNILPLVKAIAEKRSQPLICPYELVLVNNGSYDESAKELEQARQDQSWIRIITLNKNVGYGGGIQKGLEAASSKATHIGWIPADRQYSIEDLQKVWDQTLKQPFAVHKGNRTVRMDGKQTRFVSSVYTGLTRRILGVNIVDINGLPKIFPSSFIKQIDFPLSHTFTLDGQLMLAAKLKKFPIFEHPVTFYARRAGVSSWSSKRLKVYRETIAELFRMRFNSKDWFKSERKSVSARDKTSQALSS